MKPDADERLADALTGVSRLAWAVPIVFFVGWAAAWKFGLRTGLLLLGHGVALGAGAWLMETHERLLGSGRSLRPARLGFACAATMTVALVYGLYPLVRMLTQTTEPFIAFIESDDPARRLAYVTALAYTLGAGALIALVIAVRDLDRALGLPARGLGPAMVAALALAPVSAGLHLAYSLRPDLAEKRHLFALFVIGGSLAVARPLQAHLDRIAGRLRETGPATSEEE